MPRVQANEIEIFYEETGTGAPLLLIAGFACDHTNWSRMIPTLAAHYRVIAFDNRGVGQTSLPNEPFSIRHMAEDTAGLLDGLGLSHVHVAGHSMGGQIAQELVLARPELVQTLTLLSSCARIDERGKAVIESWGELPRLVDAETGLRLSFPWIYTNRFYAKPGLIERAIDEVFSNPFPPSPEGIYRQSRAITGFDATTRLDQIKCPTLVVVGSEDILSGIPFSEQLAQIIPGAELIVLEKCAHGLLTESPEATTATMLGFLSRNR